MSSPVRPGRPHHVLCSLRASVPPWVSIQHILGLPRWARHARLKDEGKRACRSDLSASKPGTVVLWASPGRGACRCGYPCRRKDPTRACRWSQRAKWGTAWRERPSEDAPVRLLKAILAVNILRWRLVAHVAYRSIASGLRRNSYRIAIR